MDGMKSMDNDSVKLTLTDIPFDEVNNNKQGTLRVIKKGDADIITFNLDEFLKEVCRVTKGTIIVFCGKNQMSRIYKFFLNQGGTVRQIIWEKTNPSPMNGGKIYLSGIENAVWFKKPNATFNAFCKNTVFRYPIGSSEIHPTEKNHRLLAELISDNSNVDDLVFDPCAGSGSTLLVAHQMGRKYLGFELNSDYYKKARKRLKQETAQMNIYDYMKGE